MISYLIVCPLVFVAGFIDAIAGGGGLISLPAYILTGLPIHNCIATNKMSSFMGTSISTYKYARNGFIPWKFAVFCVPCAMVGSSIGANLALLVSPDIFIKIMLVVLPLTGAYVLTRGDLNPKEEGMEPLKSILISMAVALCVGAYDGFYGPGTGTFLILLLTGVAKFRIEKANGLTKAINWSTNFAALTVFLINGQVLFPLGIVAGLFNIMGNYIGASKFSKGGSKVAKPVIVIVLGMFFIKIIYDMFF